jgi:hypothetical protein
MAVKGEFLESVSSSRISRKQAQYGFLDDQSGEHMCGYRALWRAVITQALMDAGSNSNKLEFRKEKARAIAWLNGDSDDFIEVCEMAGLEPSYVKKRAKEAMKNGCKWRQEINPILQQKKIVEHRLERKNLESEKFLSIKMLKAG